MWRDKYTSRSHACVVSHCHVHVERDLVRSTETNACYSYCVWITPHVHILVNQDQVTSDNNILARSLAEASAT
jgi:hypothetical protein